MLRLLAPLLIPVWVTPLSAAPYRFGSPLAIQLASLEPGPCAWPLPPVPPPKRRARKGRSRASAATRAAPQSVEALSSQPSNGPPARCLTANLLVIHRDRQDAIRHYAMSYLLQQGFLERLALDFGPFLPLVLRELATGVGSIVWPEQPDLQEQARRARILIHRHLHYRLQPWVTLPTDIELEVSRLADRFFAYARQPLLITSGPRSPLKQAEAMYLKLNRGAVLRRLYRKTEAAQQVQQAFRAARRARKPHTEILAAMAEVIRQQMAKGVYLSPHLKGNAVDIRSRGLRRAAKAALRRAVSAFPGMRLIREEKIPPHFHLEINEE